MIQTNITREKLYDEIWGEPISIVSERYGVSDSYLIRVLKKLNIPRPPRGYWTKITSGKTTPLRPALQASKPEELELWIRDGSFHDTSALPNPQALLQVEETKKQRPVLSDIHVLVDDAKHHFTHAKQTHTGYLKPNKKMMADVVVSGATLHRAMNFANALFQRLESQGYRVVLAPFQKGFRRPSLEVREDRKIDKYAPNIWYPYASTTVFMGTVGIGLTIFESSEAVNGKWVNGMPIKQSPSGRLCLKVYSPYKGTDWEQEWPETKNSNLLNKIPSIIRELRSAVQTVAEAVLKAKHEAEIRKAEWKAAQERWKTDEEQTKKIKAETESREKLNEIIDNWSRNRIIEEFFTDIEKRLEEFPEEYRSIMKNRVELARRQLGHIDALSLFGNWRSAVELLSGST